MKIVYARESIELLRQLVLASESPHRISGIGYDVKEKEFSLGKMEEEDQKLFEGLNPEIKGIEDTRPWLNRMVRLYLGIKG